MKKIQKIPLTILGACDKVMSMFIPIGLALLWISATETSGWSAIVMMTIAIAATLFRGIRVWIE